MKSKKSIEENIFPNKPKKPLTPFFKYLKIMRPYTINEFPQIKVTEVVKKISEKWATEDPDYKLKLHQEYDMEYKEYMKKVMEFEKSITPEQRQKFLALEDKLKIEIDKVKRKQDLQQLGKPKKGPSAFLLYANERMKERKSDTSTKEFIRNISSQWRDLSEEDKKPYYIQAARLMEEYNKKKTEWEQRMIHNGYYNAVSHKQFSRLQNNENKTNK